MRYALAVGTHRGEVLLFPHYGEHEYLTAVSIARHQSNSSAWAEVRDDDGVRCRYACGRLVSGSDISAWRDDRLSRSPLGRPRRDVPDYIDMGWT